VGSVLCFPLFHAAGKPRTAVLPALAVCSPAKSVDARCCTTGVQDTHKTRIREVRYRWHPWYGQPVCVRTEARRGGSVVLRCVRDELNWLASLEIPEWMFDSGLCSEMKQESLAYVSGSALLSLRALLSSDADRIESGMVQAQHLCSDSGGADVDNVPIQSQAGRAICSDDATAAGAAGSLSADASPVGPDDERTPREGTSPRRASGGRR